MVNDKCMVKDKCLIIDELNIVFFDKIDDLIDSYKTANKKEINFSN